MKTKLSMLFKKVIGIYCGDRAKHKTTVWQNAGLLFLERMVLKGLNWNSSSIFSPGRQRL